MREGKFQTKFRAELEYLFPGCIVAKMDSRYRTGIPDLIMLWQDKWATFEVKAAPDSDKRPLQEHYVERMREMSFSAIVYPENAEEVLDAVQRALSG